MWRVLSAKQMVVIGSAAAVDVAVIALVAVPVGLLFGMTPCSTYDPVGLESCEAAILRGIRFNLVAQAALVLAMLLATVVARRTGFGARLVVLGVTPVLSFAVLLLAALLATCEGTRPGRYGSSPRRSFRR